MAAPVSAVEQQPARTHVWTLETYHQLPEGSRYEYQQGELLAMAEATAEHALLVGGVAVQLGNALEGGPCQVYVGAGVYCAKVDLLAIPDLTIVCGKAQKEPAGKRALLNPKVIFEILSKSTQGRDLHLKFRGFRTLDSLEEYVTISQWAPEFTMHRRISPTKWELEDFAGFDHSIHLKSLNVSIPFAGIYRLLEEPQA